MTSRQLIITIGIVVLLAILGLGLYFVFSPSKTTPAAPTGSAGSLPNSGTQNNPLGTGSAAGSPSSNNSALGKNFGVISNESVLDYFVSPANIVTAIEPDGKIIQVASGQVNTINSLLVQNIISASFSYDGTRILVSFGNPANPQLSIFNVSSKAWTAMSPGLMSPVWSPSDYRIAYYKSGGGGTESFATMDASNAKPTVTALVTLHTEDLSIAWPTKSRLVLYTKPSVYAAGSALSFNLSTTALTPITLETPGLAILWNGAPTSSSSAELEFSAAASGLGGSLSLADASGNVTQRLRFISLPSKCLFAAAMPAATTSTPYLYCGVPRDQDSLSATHLPDDYNQMALFTSDDIYRVNLQTGEIDPVFNDQSQNLDVSDVKLFNHMLFFVNRYDNKLYAISLSA